MSRRRTGRDFAQALDERSGMEAGRSGDSNRRVSEGVEGAEKERHSRSVQLVRFCFVDFMLRGENANAS